MAAGKALAAGAISAKVVALTEGVLKAMLLTKIKVALAVVLALNLIGAGVGLVYCQTAGTGQDKQGGPPVAQEKQNVPLPAGQQAEPKKDAKAEAAAGQPMAPNIPPTISSKELVAEYLKDTKAAEKKYGGPDNPKELIVEGIVVRIVLAQAGHVVLLEGTENVIVRSSVIPIGQEEGSEKEGEKATIRGKCRGLDRESSTVEIDVGKKLPSRQRKASRH